MTSRLIIEERGTFSGRRRHPHNGYYAGDFSAGPRPCESGIRYRPARQRSPLPLESKPS